MNDREEKAKDTVRIGRVDREPTDVSIKGKFEGFGGTVYIVHWRSKKENRDMDTFAYFRAGTEEPVFLWGGEDGMRYLARAAESTNAIERIGRAAFSLSGVSAIIGLLITLTICYLVLSGRSDVPGILANALTIILGFFFGSEVAKKKENA